jgi:hypothetical protein
MARTLKYPKNPPNPLSTADGVGSGFNAGGEYPTDSIDYIKFTEVEVDYAKGGGLSSVATSANKRELDSCYLYIPANLGTDYGVNYNQVSMGALGVEAASVIGSKSETEISAALAAAASSAAPEALFGTIAQGIGGVNNLVGISGAPSGADLASISGGYAFNPFMEQIFQGINFRNHNFSFKLIARNLEEAKEIAEIVKFFKMGMLPSLGDGPTTGPLATGRNAATAPSTGGTTSTAPSPFTGRSDGSRYLKVPNRFKLEFQRYNFPVGRRISSTSIESIDGLYQFKECALTNVQVSYTPDGQYVSTDNKMVPAVQLDLRFVELSIVTKNDYNATTLVGF